MLQHETAAELQKSWIWVDRWDEGAAANESAAGVVSFSRTFDLPGKPPKISTIHISADTRYKLWVNGARVAVGPSRSVPSVWYYDTIDLAPFLVSGENRIAVDVIRYFPSARAGLPFVRSSTPGLTIVGAAGEVNLGTDSNAWQAVVKDGITFPTGLPDDVFLHISERVSTAAARPASIIHRPVIIRNGELGAVRLRPRIIPLPECSPVTPFILRRSTSSEMPDLSQLFSERKTVTLPSGKISVDIQATCHSTAYLRWTFRSESFARIKLKATYSEGYEREPRTYPWLRVKDNRLDSSGLLLGSSDEVELQLSPGEATTYEPFWFRTFLLLRLDIEVEGGSVDFVSLDGWQTNYPLDVKAEWHDHTDPQGQEIFDVSVRTMRNCMVDAYSDCPFYEQLQYAGDTRFVALFHYLLSGDDRLARQAITLFASSVTPEGLLQSRVPSHVQQLIAGFSLYWILMVADHFLFFGDKAFTRAFLPLIDGVLEYFACHVDDLGLVSGIEPDIWQYVDWVASWPASPTGVDKGVPPSGRATNRHTFFSMLYVHALREAASLLRGVGRTGLVDEYLARAEAVSRAVRQHCFDGELFTDSTCDIADDGAYSWHCQSFAVLAGIVEGGSAKRLLEEGLRRQDRLSKCSYAMKFYEYRAFAQAGLYHLQYPTLVDPWRKMLADNMSTWAEDDVRQRSDCHAWSAVPLYECLAETTGLYPLEPGCTKIRFAPRLELKEALSATVCLGKDIVASVGWTSQGRAVEVVLELNRPVAVVSILPGGEAVSHGPVDSVRLQWDKHEYLEA